MARRHPTFSRRNVVVPSRVKASSSSSYEAGSATGSRVRNWKTESSGPNTAATSSLNTVRARSRAAIRNDPWAKAAIGRLVSNVIGTGIQPHPQHPDPEVRRELRQLWDDWCSEADADGLLDFYGIQELVARAYFSDGESLIRVRSRRLEDGLSVPLQLQVMEADHLPVEKTHSLSGGAEIVNGVEFNALGQRVSYHLWRRHPGDSRSLGQGSCIVPVPAAQIIHVFKPLRAGQVRGVPVLATVLLRLKSLDNFDDAVLFRQEVSNLFAGFITKQADEPSLFSGQGDPLTGQQINADDDGFTPLVGLEPGTMQELQPGESVSFADPPDAGSAYPEFMRQQLMAAAASVGVPYEVLTGDLRDVSDRALRVILNEFRRELEQLQWNVFIHQFCRRVWSAWIDSVALSGAIELPDFARRRREYLRVRWVPQGWPYIHPVQDVQSKQLEMRAGIASRSSVVLARGDDPEAVDREIAADKARAESLGLAFVTDPIVEQTNQDAAP